MGLCAFQFTRFCGFLSTVLRIHNQAILSSRPTTSRPPFHKFQVSRTPHVLPVTTDGLSLCNILLSPVFTNQLSVYRLSRGTLSLFHRRVAVRSLFTQSSGGKLDSSFQFIISLSPSRTKTNIVVITPFVILVLWLVHGLHFRLTAVNSCLTKYQSYSHIWVVLSLASSHLSTFFDWLTISL
jgi:hypothetical protein